MEENKIAVDTFLKSLSVVGSRIRRNDIWYELRVAHGIDDKPFVDKDGLLFGVKNAKINFYIFKEGTNEIPDWAPKYLKKVYTESKLDRLPENKAEVYHGVTYGEAFEQFLLSFENVQIFTPSGTKIKKWDPNVVH